MKICSAILELLYVTQGIDMVKQINVFYCKHANRYTNQSLQRTRVSKLSALSVC
jgi:hypothetical protein